MIAAIVGWLMAAMSVATFMGMLGAMWGAAKRDTAAGGFGMGRIRGHRQGVFYGPGGVIEAAGSTFAASAFAAIAMVCWVTVGVSLIALISSMVGGFILGIQMARKEANKQ